MNSDDRTILLLGAGNIGSRHLQGLALSKLKATIHIVDPSPQARALAAERLAEKDSSPALEFHFHAGLGDLPDRLDLAIIATTARPRRQLTEQLLNAHDVGAIVFEKFLFQSISDHLAIGEVLSARKIPAWVNTPRRYWPGYRALTDVVAGGSPITLLVAHDVRHGLATSVIHLVDLFALLAGAGRSYTLDGSRLIPDTGASRHSHALEFTGSLFGTSDRGDIIAIRPSPIEGGRIDIVTADNHFVIDEGRREISRLALDGSTPFETKPFELLFQSQLSHIIAEDILETGTCLLPDYAESSALHIECLRAFLQASGHARTDISAVCAIT